MAVLLLLHLAMDSMDSEQTQVVRAKIYATQWSCSPSCWLMGRLCRRQECDAQQLAVPRDEESAFHVEQSLR